MLELTSTRCQVCTYEYNHIFLATFFVKESEAVSPLAFSRTKSVPPNKSEDNRGRVITGRVVRTPPWPSLCALPYGNNRASTHPLSPSRALRKYKNMYVRKYQKRVSAWYVRHVMRLGQGLPSLTDMFQHLDENR